MLFKKCFKKKVVIKLHIAEVQSCQKLHINVIHLLKYFLKATISRIPFSPFLQMPKYVHDFQNDFVF